MKTSDEALCRGTCQNIKIPWAVLVGRAGGLKIRLIVHTRWKKRRETIWLFMGKDLFHGKP